MGTAPRSRTSAACSRSLKPDIVLSTKVRVPNERPDIGAAIAASLEASLKRLKRDHVDVFQLHNMIKDRADGGTMSVDGGARRRGAGAEQGAPAGQDSLHRLHGDRRDRGAAPRDRVGRVRHRAGAVQRAQPEPGRGAARRLSGAGFWTDPRSRRGSGRRHHRHPRARGRRAVGTRGAQSARLGRWSSRSARARATPRTSRGRAGSTRWCARGTPPASPRWRCALPSRTRKLSTTEIGLANIDELEAAIRAVEMGPLSAAALARLQQLQAGFLGEAR